MVQTAALKVSERPLMFGERVRRWASRRMIVPAVPDSEFSIENMGKDLST